MGYCRLLTFIWKKKKKTIQEVRERKFKKALCPEFLKNSVVG